MWWIFQVRGIVLCVFLISEKLYYVYLKLEAVLYIFQVSERLHLCMSGERLYCVYSRWVMLCCILGEWAVALVYVRWEVVLCIFQVSEAVLCAFQVNEWLYLYMSSKRLYCVYSRWVKSYCVFFRWGLRMVWRCGWENCETRWVTHSKNSMLVSSTTAAMASPWRSGLTRCVDVVFVSSFISDLITSGTVMRVDWNCSGILDRSLQEKINKCSREVG